MSNDSISIFGSEKVNSVFSIGNLTQREYSNSHILTHCFLILDNSNSKPFFKVSIGAWKSSMASNVLKMIVCLRKTAQVIFVFWLELTSILIDLAQKLVRLLLLESLKCDFLGRFAIFVVLKDKI